MRLSEAIRLGATMKPQCYGYFYRGDERTSSCAIGAACDAIGVHPDNISVMQVWPVTTILNGIPCPVPGCTRPGGSWMVTHLNDRHQWTRERIADFVELHEPLPILETTEAEQSVEVKKA